MNPGRCRRTRKVRTALVAGIAAVAVGVTGCSMVGGATAPAVFPKKCGPGTAQSSPKAGGLSQSGPIRQPTAPGATTISSGFGQRWGTFHRGVDFAGPVGTPIYSSLDGTVVKAGPASGFGNWVVIDSIVDGQPVSMVYGHMFQMYVTENQQVEAGDHIADIGNAGESTGPHVHVEYWEGGRFQNGTAIDPAIKLGAAAAPPPDPSVTATNPNVRLAASARANCSTFGVAGAGELKPGSVPAELEPWIRKAGSLCPQVKPSLIASQMRAESGFRRGQTSVAGAQGLTQFLPGTAAATNPDDGKPYLLDADGNGQTSIWDDSDAIMAQGRYMCSIARKIEGWIAEGTVHGDVVALTIAGYNAGEGAVRTAGGMPSGGDYDTQTKPYVAKIISGMAEFDAPAAAGRFVPNGSQDGSQVVDAARDYLGTRYVWGGGGVSGPSKGGFDCSGLTSYAVHAAVGKALPRTAEKQWGTGVEIPMAEARPGDLVFGNWDEKSGLPKHVGIYAGGGQMVHAPGIGGGPEDVVKQEPTQPGMKARRVL
uniref:peptidoglycan DD-metalloendopeptidase family protein n=1 Tax=Nocardia suismassiliense TaxID=2077092 RepID=UPI003F497504